MIAGYLTSTHGLTGIHIRQVSIRRCHSICDTPGVAQMAGMALDVTGTHHRYLCNWNTLSSHHLALSWILLVSSNSSLSHFTSVLGPRAQLLTLTCPQTILLAHKLRSTSCHDDFSFDFHPFFSRLEALECPGIWLQNDPLLGKIGHIIAEL